MTFLRRPVVACLLALALPACSLSTGGVDDQDYDDGRPGDDGASGEVAADADAADDAAPDRPSDETPGDVPEDEGGAEDVPDEAAGPDDEGGRPDDGSPDVEPEVADDAGPDDAPPEDAPEAVDDAPVEVELPCGGARVGGFCWYASGVNEDCNQACLAHGGCDLAGTRDFAGSGGSDANCVAVLAALGYGAYAHQDFSNNELGCHYAWDSWTYWSTERPTACEGSYPGAAARAVRMCACYE